MNLLSAGHKKDTRFMLKKHQTLYGILHPIQYVYFCYANSKVKGIRILVCWSVGLLLWPGLKYFNKRNDINGCKEDKSYEVIPEGFTCRAKY